MATARLASVETLAEILNYRPKTIYELVSSRRIPFVRIGRSVRFDLDEIEAWLKAKHVPAIDRCVSAPVLEM